MSDCFTVSTEAQGFYEVTDRVSKRVAESGVTQGLCCVFCPHTTAAITINENADPDVVQDMLVGLDKAYPDRSEFRHFEGNSAAHLKASALGSASVIPVVNGRLALGRWQGIYLCEFDGPRTRTVRVTLLGA